MQQPEVTNKRPPTIMKSAAFMALGTLASRILGMVREMVLTALFPRMVSDAFAVAFRLPNLFRRVLGEGSLAAAFVPLYVDALHKDEISARQFKNSIYSMLTSLTATLSVLGIIFMEPILSIMVSGEGFMSIAGKFELTLLMARVMFGFLYLVTTYAFFMSVANSHGIFFVPAMAPAVFNAVFILCAFMPAMQVQGDQLAWAVIIAGVLQLLVSAWPLFRNGYLPRLTRTWAVPQVRHFFKNIVPSMIGMGIAQLLGVLNVFFASQLGQGTHSYIYFADRVLEIPQALLSVSLGVALLPSLSGYFIRGEKDQMLAVSQKYTRMLLALSLPSAVGLYFLAEPIVKVLYERGEFKAYETIATAQILSIYAVTLIFTSVHRVTVPLFYAVKNTRVPAINSAFCLVLHFFIAGYATPKWGITGLVGATALTGFINLFILLFSQRALIGPVGFLPMLKSIVHLTPALVVLAVICYLGFPILLGFSGLILGLVLTILLAASGFFLAAHLTRHPETMEITGLLRSKLQRKLGV